MTRVYNEVVNEEGASGLAFPCPFCGRYDASFMEGESVVPSKRSGLPVIIRSWTCGCGTRFTSRENVSSVRPNRTALEAVLRNPVQRATLSPGTYTYMTSTRMAVVYSRKSASKWGEWRAVSAAKGRTGGLNNIRLGDADDPEYKGQGMTFDDALEHKRYAELARSVELRAKEQQRVREAQLAAGVPPEEARELIEWGEDDTGMTVI